MARILIIEDDAPIAAVLERGLGLVGHDVTVVGDSHEGRRRWSEGRWEAIILDLMLPGANGLELCAERRRAGDRTPVLLLTARDEESVRRQALRSGASAMMTKPFAYADLIDWIRGAVGDLPEAVARAPDGLDV
jgi:DNA-binding response OmpR family regulator